MLAPWADAGPGPPTTVREAGTGADGGIALDDDSVWVHNADDFLLRLDRETGARREQVTVEVTSGGDMPVHHGAVWVTAYDDQALFRIGITGTGS